MTPEQCNVFQIFSHPLRVQMMTLLGQRPHTLLELTAKLQEPFGASYGMVCSHFQILRGARVVDTERVEEESKVIHWLVPGKLVDAIDAFVHEAGLVIPPRKRTAKKKSASARKKKSR